MYAYINVVCYEASLKQKLASLIGREFNNLASLTIKDLLHEVEVSKKDYINISDCCKKLHPVVEEAYRYLG